MAREFKGELHPNRGERNFETKRLRAYLKGWKFFCFGGPGKNMTGVPVRQYFSVESGSFSHEIPVHLI